MECEKCNKDNPSDARYCWNCGEKLPSSQPVGKKELSKEDSDILSQLNILINKNN